MTLVPLVAVVLGVLVPGTLLLRGARQGRGHLGGGPVPRAAQLRHVLPRVRGPRESRRREEQEAECEPHPRGRVPRPRPAIRVGLPRARHQGDPGAAAPTHAASVQHHEHDAADGHHTQPRGRELAVEPPRLTQQQVPVQAVDRGAQRQCTAGPVDGHVPHDPAGPGVHEDPPGLGTAQGGVGEHDARGAALGGGAHRHGCVVRADLALGGPDLPVDAPRGLGPRAGEGVGVDRPFELRCEHVQQPGQGGDHQEGPHEDPGVEVQSSQQGHEPGVGGARTLAGALGRRCVQCCGHDEVPLDDMW